MRVYCKECGGKGRISSRNDLSKEFTTLYCICLECGHRWAANLTFSHTLTPSAQMMDRFVIDRLRDMPKDRQKELLGQLGMIDAR